MSGCKTGDHHGCPDALYLISIAGSAGAFTAASRLLSRLSLEAPAAVAILLHSASQRVLLDAFHSLGLPATPAGSGERLKARHLYVAPAGAHLIVNSDGRVSHSTAHAFHPFRPSADWLFGSAAASFGDRHVAIVLSGRLDDGVAKLVRVRQQGGTVVVQDPETCRFPEMPRAAIATGQVDYILPVEEMPAVLDGIFAKRALEIDVAQWLRPFRKAWHGPPRG